MNAFRMGVVIPARNEAAQLPDLLRSLLDQAGVVLEVVVVANGCKDDTAAVARGFGEAFAAAGHALQIVEIAEASKAAALRVGDGVVKTLPKAYVDADLVLSPSALADVAATLDTSEPCAAAPRLRFAAPPDTAHLARFVEATPPFSNDVIGGGFYAVNAAGRQRFGAFPALVGDDAFVLGHFQAEERRLVCSAEFRCRFPDRARLGAVLTRWEFGRRQAAAAGTPGPSGGRAAAILATLARPGLWPVALLWWRLKCQARLAAKRRALDDFNWARADGASGA
jgi:glycosyltransferase involved in cell wall biosynthesis